MMKIVQINATCGIGSTGRICLEISKILNENNIENYILCSKNSGYKQGITVSNDLYLKGQALKSRILGNYGFNSENATQKIIENLNNIKPDIVHLHNIHGHDVNLEMLFTYFKANKIKLVWTFHDCWAFTGYCTHFDMVKCEKWQNSCHNCIQKKSYSWFFDKSNCLYNKKKELFSGLDLSIVTPSLWLAEIVKKSFLKDYPVYVINNGIDLNTFKPVDSEFIEKYHLENKKIILGVASNFDNRKGLDYFIDLGKSLPEDFKIILVGTSSREDRLLPDGIISKRKTENQTELSKLYSMADVFVNPTREDTFPTVNMEAIACGTPVITFNVGGSSEMLDDKCGSVIESGNITALKDEIIRVCNNKPYLKTDCINKSYEFDKNLKFKEYLSLYERIITG